MKTLQIGHQHLVNGDLSCKTLRNTSNKKFIFLSKLMAIMMNLTILGNTCPLNWWQQLQVQQTPMNLFRFSSLRILDQQLSFIHLSNPNIKIKSMIVHPGEATIIKANQSKKLIATKNDQSGVYVWDPNKHKTIQAKDGCHAAQSDIQLIGHQQLPSQGCNGLDWFGEQKICSGGRDQRILIWDIGDYQTKLSTSTLFQNKRELNNIVGQDNLRLDRRQSIQAQHELIDAQFNKFNQEQILGISFDQIAGWDLRQDQKVFEILKHKDITSGEWSQYDENQIAYGTQDGQLFIYDLRNQQEIQIREGHRTSINCIRFGPDKNHITIGSDELYSINIINKKITFCYYGHKGSINDFEINERSPWTYVSTCFENHNEISGGGQLHIYRLMDLIYLQS
ncbi:hypothetical protein pb186bvf_010772 [Paramecium bursaria]